MKPPMPVFIQADARALPLPDESVDLVVTSPPYFGLRDYGYDGQIGAEPTPAEFLDTLIACTAEMVRILKPAGSIFVNLGDKYSTGNSGESGMAKLGERYRGGGHADVAAKQRSDRIRGMPPKSLLLIPERYRIRCVDDLGLIARAVVVWSKPNGLPESVTDRVRRSHEDWVHLTRQPRYYSAVDEIRLSHRRGWTPGRTGGHTYQAMRAPGEKDSNLANSSPNPLGALPGSVWEIPTQPLKAPAELGTDHYAAFPMELPRRIILGWSPRHVCTACGEGRRPVADRTEKTLARPGGVEHVGTRFEGMGPDRVRTRVGDAHTVHRVTGYACACADTFAPSTPGVVLDVFSGTGTAPLVAAMHGRRGIGVELSADYIRLAQWRAADPKERARAAGLDPDAVAKLRPETPGQSDLFELFGGGAA
jgi:DNA modification methylase